MGVHTSASCCRYDWAVPLHDVDVPLHDVDVPLHDVDVPLHDVDVPLHDVDVPFLRLLADYHAHFASSEASAFCLVPSCHRLSVPASVLYTSLW